MNMTTAQHKRVSKLWTAAKDAHERGAITTEDLAYVLALANTLVEMMMRPDSYGHIRLAEDGAYELTRVISKRRKKGPWSMQDTIGIGMIVAAGKMMSAAPASSAATSKSFH